MLYYKIYLFRLIELFKKMMKKIILIAGPTASGKSSLANILAKKINGEIVNADSVQIYKDLKILQLDLIYKKMILFITYMDLLKVMNYGPLEGGLKKPKK